MCSPARAAVVAGMLWLAACDRAPFEVPVDPTMPGPVMPGDADGGTTTPIAQPEQALLALAAGRTFSCARNRTVLGCWGNVLVQRALGVDENATVGSANVTFGGFSLVPSQPATDLSADGDRLCLVQEGRIVCIVQDDPAFTTDEICRVTSACGYGLRNVAGLPEPARSVGVSQDHACFVGISGHVYCWGRNDVGQLGHPPGTAGDHPCVGGTGVCGGAPALVEGLQDVAQVSVGSRDGQGASCAVTQDRQLHCWGSNIAGQLGIGSKDSMPHFQPVAIPSDYRSVSVGPNGVCAVPLSGVVVCWGDDRAELNSSGFTPRTIGRFTEIDRGSWTDLSNIVQVSRGAFHTCAVDGAGRVWCWGRNPHGELGRGREGIFDGVCTVEGAQVLCSIGGASRVESISGVKAVAVGAAHTCAAKGDGSLWCWGSNTDGQVGIPVRNPEDARNYTSAVTVRGSLK
ncbi:MAG TPA: hypothetical protein VFH73_07710 [Polyangia bacterium]|jgi:hypothetical protein|nr:hypothetical protein [Polyangia bacterium]